MRCLLGEKDVTARVIARELEWPISQEGELVAIELPEDWLDQFADFGDLVIKISPVFTMGLQRARNLRE
jgi:hypothetical protein